MQLEARFPKYVDIPSEEGETCSATCSHDDSIAKVPLPFRLLAAHPAKLSEIRPACPSLDFPPAGGDAGESPAGRLIDELEVKRTPLSSRAADFVPSVAQVYSHILGLPSAVRGTDCNTVMMRNLPFFYTRDKLIDLMDSHGFSGHYDLAYLPIDWATGGSVGYGFVNLTTAAQANRFFEIFQAFQDWTPASPKVCAVCWAEVQGLQANIQRYRNNYVMNIQVPDVYKPALFSRGMRIPFPAPTRTLQSPWWWLSEPGEQAFRELSSANLA